MLYIIPVIVIFAYFLVLSIAGDWFVYNSLAHNLVIEHLVDLSKQNLLTDSLKEWYLHFLFIVERIFDLVLFLPFCLLLFKLKINRKALTLLTALGYFSFHAFVFPGYQDLNTYAYLSFIWWFILCCGLVNIDQLFGIINREQVDKLCNTKPET